MMWRAWLMLMLPLWLTAAPLVETLDNGLTAVVQENHTAPVAAFRIYVKTGSLYEQEFLGTGISHVFEHLIHGGTTKTRTEKEIKEILDRLGGAANAYTYKDHTCYHLMTEAGQIGTTIDLMADWMLNCTFPEAEYTREMGVVMEELYKGREEPMRIISQALDDTMFQVHPTRLPIIGYEEQLKRITHADIVAYYKRMYVPNNLVVVAVGAFHGPTVMARIKTAFGPMVRQAVPLIPLPEEPRQLGRRERTIEKDGLGGAYFRLGFHTVGLHHDDLYPLDLLSYILSRGRSARLVRTIKEEQRLAASIGSYSSTPSYGAGAFVLYGNTAPDKTDAAIAATLKELYRTRDELVSEEELRTAITQMLADDVLGKQTAEDEAEGIGSSMLGTGTPDFDKLYLSRLRAVTPAQIQAVARRYFSDDQLSVVVLRPPVAAATPAAVTAGATDAAAPADPFPIRKLTLPNGLRVLLKRNPNKPLVNLQVVFLGGVRLEPAGQEGISALTAELLTRGAGTLSREDLARAFDQIGGNLGPTSGNNSFGLSVEVLAEHFPRALELASLIIREPSFPERELETVRGNTLQAIARQNDDWDDQLLNEFRQAYFTSHPYRNSSLGTEASIKSLTPALIRAFYESRAIPSQGVLTVFGDIDLDQTAAALTKAFGALTRPAAAPLKLTPQAPRTAPATVPIPGRKRLAAIAIGYPGLQIGAADSYAMTVLDAVLSGIGYPSGWLHEHLRGGDRDLVYVVHAFGFTGLEPGYFMVMAASSGEKMPEVQRIIMEDIAAIRQGPVSAAVLERAKAMCITMEKLGRQTNRDMALQAALDELYGLGYQYSQGYDAGIRAVTAADVHRVAQKYLVNPLTVLLAPPPAAEPPPAEKPAK